jgi:hypothetical protein
MPQNLTDRAKKFVDDTKKAIQTGNQQTEGLGHELAARAEMNRQGAAALKGDSAEPAKSPESASSPVDKVNSGPYGSRGSEKRIDTTEMTKPLGSFKKGTDSVPKTGVYKVHEGEKIVAAKDNKMEHSPEEKAHFHRAMHHLNDGALHRHLGIPEDQPIPMEKKQEAANSDNPHVAAMGRMAVAMHGWKHLGKK